MMNKKGQTFRLEQFVIGFLIFSLLVTVGISLIGDLNTNYGLSMNTSEFTNTYTKINETYNLAIEIKNDTIDADVSNDEPWRSMAKGSYSALRLLKNTFSTSGAIANDIAEVVGIPGYMVTIGITVLLLLILFTIIYLVMGIVGR